MELSRLQKADYSVGLALCPPGAFGSEGSSYAPVDGSTFAYVAANTVPEGFIISKRANTKRHKLPEWVRYLIEIGIGEGHTLSEQEQRS